MICSELASSDSPVTDLDISGNEIPDKQLKMLMGMLYMNDSLIEIKYTLNGEHDQQRLQKF